MIFEVLKKLENTCALIYFSRWCVFESTFLMAWSVDPLQCLPGNCSLELYSSASTDDLLPIGLYQSEGQCRDLMVLSRDFREKRRPQISPIYYRSEASLINHKKKINNSYVP